MRKRKPFVMLLAGLGAASGLALSSCNDYTTGQDGEPEGPLRLTRLTLFDNHVSRDVAVFSDTSAPRDCDREPEKSTERCQNDPYKDRYGLLRSPPTPDSGRDIRIVFNKLPLLLNGMDLENITQEPMKPPTKIELRFMEVATLKCAGPCTGVPSNSKALQLTGSDLSPDPTAFPYGPAVQITVDTDDPLAALEPETEYQVEVNPGLSGRDGNKVELDQRAQQLLRFTTEPFKVLQVGIGDTDHDTWVYSQAGQEYEVKGLANNGVLAIKLNASVDPSVFKMATVQATIGNVNVPVKIGLNQITTNMMTMKTVCDPGNQRTLYVYPTARAWQAMPMEGSVVTVTIQGSDIRDVSQAEGHPAGMGRHTLKSNIVVRATLTGKPAAMDYAGLTADTVAADDDCPRDMSADMGGGDM